MKQRPTKQGKLIFALALAILLTVFSLPGARAARVWNEEVVHIKSDEVIGDDLYVSGREILIDGVVQGDVIAIGQQVTINGTVEGDLMAGAQVVTINGEVSDDLRAGGQIIQIKGNIGDDVLVGGFSLESGPESKIGGDLLMGGFQALLQGELNGSIFGGFGGLKISGQVDGDVDVAVGEDTGDFSPRNFMIGMPDIPPIPFIPMGLTLDETASIAGDLTYRGPTQIQIDQTTVSGEVEFIQQETPADETNGFGTWVWEQIQRLLRLLLFGVLIVWLAPAFVRASGQKLQQKLWPSLGWGALTPIIFLIVLIILGVISLIVGFPALVFGTMIFGYLLVLFYLGSIVVGQCLGYWLLQRLNSSRAENTMLSTLLGLVAIWIITMIPILGHIAGFFVALFGTGTLWLMGREHIFQKNNHQKAEAISMA